ncbi:MAG: DUF4136 domain-containing protein [Gammaproteobacteria bacterium]|nr:DUF4136 domain-containing protein [Gammaproteobacteria bacterium]MDH4255270.1 DUF4136 domain-containing protein [Gammaproteobacteria bacterium]MDH5310002.1 DUF4136 domain-containing protein [Gammaproteobacteria bacterium]
MQTNKLVLRAAIFACAIALAGCSSGGKIRSDFDKTVDFSDYRTYNFFADAGPDTSGYQSLFSQYMTKAIDREMVARGYQKSDDPDLLINFNARLEDKTKVSTSPAPMYGGYGYYGYRRGFYDPWMGYGYATETHVSQYTEGTVNIDLVDARQKKLVWEAVGIGRVRDDAFENLEARVNAAVPKFFESYPFRAGEGVAQP